MFDLLDRPLVWIAVKWPGLAQGDDESALATRIEHEVELQVEIIDRDEFAKWLASNNADAENPDIDPVAELAIVKTVAKAWRKIKSGGRTVEFNDANLAALIRFPGFVSAFGTAYMRAWQGQAETRSGNSESSPASGQAGAAPSETTTAATSTS